MDQAARRIDHCKAFEAAAVRFLPGFLYSLNFADAKRRNDHLGHRVVDRDIEEFEELLRRRIAGDSFIKRVGGDRWLMISRPNRAEDVGSVLSEFAQSEAIEVGWCVRAEKNGVSKRSRNVVPAEISRAVRCLFAEVRTREEMIRAIEQIEENDWDLPVNRPLSLDDVVAMDRVRWRCVSDYPTGSPTVCPFCGCKDLEWLDGDGSVYSGSGECNDCGAAISIKPIQCAYTKER